MVVTLDYLAFVVTQTCKGEETFAQAVRLSGPALGRTIFTLSICLESS